MSEIKTPPTSKKYRENYDRVFSRSKCSRKTNSKKYEHSCYGDILKRYPELLSLDKPDDGKNSYRGFQTEVCANNDPHFGG